MILRKRGMGGQARPAMCVGGAAHVGEIAVDPLGRGADGPLGADVDRSHHRLSITHGAADRSATVGGGAR